MAKVKNENEKSLRMSELQIGDRVQTGKKSLAMSENKIKEIVLTTFLNYYQIEILLKINIFFTEFSVIRW